MRMDVAERDAHGCELQTKNDSTAKTEQTHNKQTEHRDMPASINRIQAAGYYHDERMKKKRSDDGPVIDQARDI